MEIEHVVFDGGSTDNTVEILKLFSPPVRWLSEKDKGQTDAVNKGILATDAEIIGWLNSDDIYYLRGDYTRRTKILGPRVKVHREINDMFKKMFGRVPNRWLFSYAHAVLRQHSRRNDDANFFAMKVGIVSVWSALKWNWGVSAEMRKTVYSWISL